MLRDIDLSDAPTPPAQVEPKAAAPLEPRAAARIAPMEPTIPPGTVLDGTSILALCQARDLGVAAATGDPLNPPELLRTGQVEPLIDRTYVLDDTADALGYIADGHTRGKVVITL